MQSTKTSKKTVDLNTAQATVITIDTIEQQAYHNFLSILSKINFTT